MKTAARASKLITHWYPNIRIEVLCSQLTVRWLLLLGLVVVAGCSQPLSITEPFDVSRAGESAEMHFSLTSPGSYRLALLFATADTRERRERQYKLWGDPHNEGIPVELNVRITLNNHNMLDERVKTIGTTGITALTIAERRMNTYIRSVKYLDLAPGQYTAKIENLNSNDHFKETKTFIDFGFYNPKH